MTLFLIQKKYRECVKKKKIYKDGVLNCAGVQTRRNSNYEMVKVSTLFHIDKGMLMYGKEASNRKQEIDRQHYTIPNQRPKDKHCGKI